MSTVDLPTLAARLDALLNHGETPDYSAALNGVQLAHRGPVRKIAAAVDFSRRTVEGAIDVGANLLLVHHGMFWSGAQPIVGAAYERLRLLLEHDVAVYASHLPLDRHPELGNNPLMARALGLEPAGEFARYKTISVGVRGEADVETQTLVDRARAFARAEGGDVIATPAGPGRRTRRWGICTGSGASPETLAEAASLRLDTLVVGEGPHYTAVAAEEAGLVVIYAGHYATETLGVRALAGWVEREFGVPWEFVAAPTGL
jgi:dinuclear metal center YbgI/SA1388 family protein